MSTDRAEIVNLIDRLDHPDAGIQNQALNRLTDRLDEARPTVLANLSEVNARVRRALLRWLDDHLVREATLPLMRYVFDYRKEVAEQMGRSMAMSLLLRRARTTDQPDERGRLRAFAEDVSDDDNPDVRRIAVRILGFVGNQRSLPAVQARRDDSDDEVRAAATKTLEVLREISSRTDADTPHVPPSRLRRRLLNSAGAVRRQLIGQWRSHPDRSRIAVDILSNRGELRRQALQILLRDPLDDARPLLTDIVFEQPDDELTPLALRLIAKLGDADPTGDEPAAIRRALESRSVLTRAGACKAAGALQMKDLTERLTTLSQSRELPLALDAARSLTELVDRSDHELLPRLVDSLRTNERRRRRDRNQRDRVHLVAHLLSAIRQVVSPSTIGVRALHRAVLDILADAGDEKPLVVTGLQVLLQSTPRQGLDEFDQWKPADATALLQFVPRADEPTARRVAELLRRGAPKGLAGLDDATRRLWDGGHVNVAEVVVPLLDRAGTDQADRWLQQIADGDAEPAATEANRILRRRRNDQDVIDVEFIPRDDDSEC